MTNRVLRSRLPANCSLLIPPSRPSFHRNPKPVVIFNQVILIKIKTYLYTMGSKYGTIAIRKHALINRGYCMATRRYEISLRVLKKFRISKRPCNFLLTLKMSNNKILSFVSWCGHLWCRSRRFDCILLFFFRRGGRLVMRHLIKDDALLWLVDFQELWLAHFDPRCFGELFHRRSAVVQFSCCRVS